MISFIIMFILLCCIVFCFYMLYRNNLVHVERIKILGKIREMGSIDINNHKYDKLDGRLEKYRTISYDEMLYKFWIPIKDFYKDIDWNE